MNDNFDRRFRARRDEFDRDFEKMRRFGTAFGVVTFLIGLGLLGFFIWLVLVLFQFFGVI